MLPFGKFPHEMGWVDSQSDDVLANKGMREWIPGHGSFGGVRESGGRRLPLQENMPTWGHLGDSVSAHWGGWGHVFPEDQIRKSPYILFRHFTSSPCGRA